MILREIKEHIIVFDNESEANDKFHEVRNLENMKEVKAYKDYSDTFGSWVYVVKYKTKTEI